MYTLTSVTCTFFYADKQIALLINMIELSDIISESIATQSINIILTINYVHFCTTYKYN